ncbi:hypothetical protein NUU61_003650 [Penicillium alfredii]|uniref:F-box domain-containing protein n=1 Tax=Penicillium alfredii TaxID=1506179 RepID=A0A9W9KD62_9EURO|nr:uncharacterized protein NUU61_003650 [Penicillium alfredii]KAJ5101428.1 hypothetical protein NUU61_003650 [Penicillium alfredii]
MNQYWRIIAPRRKESTADLGRLDECLLRGKASALVPLLAVPLMAHGHEHVEVIPGENVEDEDDDFECTKRPRKNGLPQNHSSKAARIEHHNAVEAVRTANVPRPGSLYDLPSEIHHHIFARLTNVEDVLRLSLTNRYFWAVGLSHIEDHIITSLAPWAGEQIICVGNCGEPGDYPPGLWSAAEQKAMRALAHHSEPMNLYALGHTYHQVGEPSLSQQLQSWFQQYEAEHPMSKADRAEILMGLRPEISEFYPRDQPWVLRNLTTKEYVRGEVIALKGEFVRGPQIDVLGFPEVLISRICWSVSNGGLEGQLRITRGKWAGHRFDITPLSVHEKKTQNKCWMDVSNEVLREIDVLASEDLGDDWRQHLAQEFQTSHVPILAEGRGASVGY